MALNYVCRKCDKSYSREEFDKSSYCKECGTYLLKSLNGPRISISSKHEALTGNFETSSSYKNGNPNLERVAQNIRQRSEAAKEYEVVITKKAKPKSSGSTISDGWIFGSEFDDALRLKTDLLLKFKDKNLEESIPGEVVSNENGECYCIVENHTISFEKVSLDKSRGLLLSELKLLPGIGFSREQTLKHQGYKTIEDLASHPRWRKSACEFLNLVDLKDVSALQSRLRRSLPKSHPLAHYLAGFCRDEDLAIIDIETMGLFGRPIILVGVANIRNRGVCTRQFLVRDVAEEACALSKFTSNLKSDCAFVSFNGRCFDVPFIRERIAYYGLGSDQIFGNPHFDMLHFTRRAYRDKLANCRLETVEKYLGIHRGINIPGALVPEFYDSYQRSGNVGPLVAIVEHNKQDLVTLSQLFCSLYGEWKL